MEDLPNDAHLHPQLCENDCGFYGSAITLNLCSKCFKLLHKDGGNVAAPASIVQTPVLDQVANVKSPEVAPMPQESVEEKVIEVESVEKSAPTKKAKKNRCGVCGLKLRLAQRFNCRCESVFCNAHRFADAHECSFDYKKHAQDLIVKQNPKIQAEKLEKI